MIQSGNIHLATHLLNHEAHVTLTNDAGLDCVATAEQLHQQRTSSRQSGRKNAVATISEWKDFIQELKAREESKRARNEARDRARSQANDE